MTAANTFTLVSNHVTVAIYTLDKIVFILSYFQVLFRVRSVADSLMTQATERDTSNVLMEAKESGHALFVGNQ